MEKLAIVSTGLVVVAFIIVILPTTLKMNIEKREWFYAAIAILAAIMSIGACVYAFIISL